MWYLLWLNNYLKISIKTVINFPILIQSLFSLFYLWFSFHLTNRLYWSIWWSFISYLSINFNYQFQFYILTFPHLIHYYILNYSLHLSFTIILVIFLNYLIIHFFFILFKKSINFYSCLFLNVIIIFIFLKNHMFYLFFH